jgi:two-component system sensor histidine kinase RpfC
VNALAASPESSASPPPRALGIALLLALGAAAGPLLVAGFRLTEEGGFASSLLAFGAAAALLAAPAVAAIAVAMHGLGAVAARFAERPDSEHEQIMIRVGMGIAVLAYSFGMMALAETDRGLADAFVIAAFAQALGWLFLAHIVMRPEPLEWRRLAAMALDVGSLSLFLHLGGSAVSAWYPVYLWVTFGYGFRYGNRHLLLCGAASVAGFGLVVATTVFWQDDLALSAGLIVALIVLPAYVGRLIRMLTEAKRQAEAAGEAKGRFLAIMSHELRTPLNTVVGMASLIGKGPLDPDQRDMLGTLQIAARTLLGLISDILDFSRIDAGRFRPQTESFDLYETAQQTIAMLRPEAAGKGLHLGLRIDPALPDMVRGWPQQFRQVLLNLLVNAVKFTPQGRIAVALDEVGRDQKQVRVRLTVRDQGIGIAPEARDKIFELFSQADEAVTRRYGGTGLGLAIVKQLVTLMGGTVAVESEVGKGSTFTVEVPLEIDATAVPRPLDLGGRAVGVLGEEDFAARLEPYLTAWNARLVAERPAAEEAGAVIIDGRADAMAALATAHRIAARREVAVILVADPAWSEHIAALAEGRLAAVLPAPVEQRALANALRAMPHAPPPREPSVEMPPAPAPVLPRPSSRRPRRPLRVLVAEDNSANRKIMQRMLEMAGHQAQLVNDGEAALDALEHGAFDVALLDINMPVMSGYEATKLYRTAHMDERRLPIIALTADATVETERLCREAGIDAVLTKPVDAEQLVLAIEETVARVVGSDVVAAAPPPPPPSLRMPDGPAIVTPISVHPRFGLESGPVVDDEAIEALRALGADTSFFNDVIETFRIDARGILDQLGKSAAEGDLRQFREHAHSLRSSAANVGGARLCEMLLALRDLTQRELRSQGAEIVERVSGELARLDAALEQKLKEAKLG